MKANVFFIVGLTAMTLLSACGDSNKNTGGAVPSAGGTATTTPSQADSFISTIRGTVANAPDDTEPTDIDSVQATAPEESEPEDL